MNVRYELPMLYSLKEPHYMVVASFKSFLWTISSQFLRVTSQDGMFFGGFSPPPPPPQIFLIELIPQDMVTYFIIFPIV